MDSFWENYTLFAAPKGKPPTGRSKSQKDKNQELLPGPPAGDQQNLLVAPRPWLCPDPDIIVLCYSVNDIKSMKEAENVIWPDLRSKFEGVPILLVATKCDLRDYEEDFWSMEENTPNAEGNYTPFISQFVEQLDIMEKKYAV
jgi:hypothetical protein